MNLNYAATARSTLAAFTANVEQGRAMGRRNRGPWTPERVAKMRETQAVLNAMSNEARRYYHAEKRSRWLTNVLRVDGDRKVFHLQGADPLTKRKFAMHLEFDLDVSLSEFLCAIMNCADAPLMMRLDAAKNAAVLTHPRPKARVVVNGKRSSSVVAPAEAEPAVSRGEKQRR